MNPEIDFVTLLGQAGTGKTLLTLAAGLMLTLEFKVYTEIIMTRVTVPVGEDIGFLPGTEEEKMNPWMGALEDNLDVLNKTDDEAGEWGRAATRDLIRSRIKVKSLNFMRGRTFINKFLIIDEAQNLTPKQMKTLITRAGPGHQGRVPRQHRADRHALPDRGQLGAHLRRRPLQGLVALAATSRCSAASARGWPTTRRKCSSAGFDPSGLLHARADVFARPWKRSYGAPPTGAAASARRVASRYWRPKRWSGSRCADSAHSFQALMNTRRSRPAARTRRVRATTSRSHTS